MISISGRHQCALGVLVLSCGLMLSAQMGSASRRPSFSELRDKIDDATVKSYLDDVDKEIASIASRYPQFMGWNITKGGGWSDAGKARTLTSLEYGYSLVLSKSSNYLDRYGANGLHIRVRILSQQMFALVAGPSIGSVVFGAQVGGGCVIATVLSEKPKNDELEMKVSGILKSRLGGQTCY